MGTLVKNRHLNLYKRYTEQLISDLGKIITVFLGEKEEMCNNCKYDMVHKCSSGIYNGTGPQKFNGMVCPVCKGSGKISTVISKKITAICRFVNYSKDDEMNSKQKYGVEEETYLKVKAKVQFYNDFHDAKYFEYDGERYRLKTLIKRGMKEHVVCVAYLERENV